MSYVTLGPEMCGLAIAGPASRALLAEVTEADVSAHGMRFMAFCEIDVGLAPVWCGRISFTGDLGYELWMPARYQRYVFDLLREAGTSHGLELFGLLRDRDSRHPPPRDTGSRLSMGPRRPPNETLNDCKHISAFHVVELQDSKSPARFGSVDADVAVLTAFATPFMAMLAMLWHQQRAILKQLGENGERLARIEGYLDLGEARRQIVRRSLG